MAIIDKIKVNGTVYDIQGGGNGGCYYGYLNGGVFYKESTHTTVITGVTDTLYVDLEANNEVYKFNGTGYVKIAEVNQTISTGTTNGTISVGGTDVSVHGLGDAAYASVVNNLSTTTTGDALDAAQGKALSDRIESLEGRGRYLAVWNCTTGKPTTDPATLPYAYKAGDYYIVGTVPASGTKYKPNGASYTGAASTTAETDNVKANDLYLYDGTNWSLANTATKTVSFSSIGGNATDNTSLASALGAKVDTTTTVNGNALSGNVTVNGSQIALDGYAKPSATSAIAATDTVNAALGKLEKALDSTGAAWGSITGTLSNQTDLNTALTAKEDTSNKKTTIDATTGVSDTFFPSCKAVKTYVDAAIAAIPVYTGTVTP